MAWKVMMPKKIMFGENAAKEFPYPDNALVITTTTPDIYNKWLDYMGIKNYEVYDKVTPDPAIEIVEGIRKEYEAKDVSCYIGLGGGSSLDVCKYLGKLTGKPKILIPTTFGTGAEMTTYAVISFNHKKKLLQDEAFLADAAIVDPYFLPGTPFNILRNSACDAAAQASEAYDSKLSYPFSNEGVPHGYALSSCTTVAHKFNKSRYYERFKRICQKLKFEPIKLKKPLDQAADDIMPDRGHLDNNPIPVTKQDAIQCLDEIVSSNPLA